MLSNFLVTQQDATEIVQENIYDLEVDLANYIFN